MPRGTAQIALYLLIVASSSQAADDSRRAGKESPAAWIDFRATVSATFRKRTEQTIRDLPASIRRKLKRKGWKVVAAQFVVDAAPDLKGRVPRGWPAGSTWSNSDAVHLPARKTIIVAEKRLSLSGMVVNVSRVTGVLRHEIGHAFDMAAALDAGKKTFYSSTDRFKQVYHSDLIKMSAEHRRRLKYFAQSGRAGKQESFAEAFAILLGGGSDPQREKIFRSAFPRVVKHVRSMLK